MRYRTGLEIKKTILDQLADRPHVLSELECRVATNDRVLKRHLEELAYLGVVQLTTHPRHARTGRPFTTVAINPYLNPIGRSYPTEIQQSPRSLPEPFPATFPKARQGSLPGGLPIVFPGTFPGAGAGEDP